MNNLNNTLVHAEKSLIYIIIYRNYYMEPLRARELCFNESIWTLLGLIICRLTEIRDKPLDFLFLPTVSA